MARFWLLLLATLTLTGVSLSPQYATGAQADVDDFSYASWHVDYVLDVDAEGRGIARVTETLVAQFPDFDQNRGIVRALPLKYERADAAPENIGVTDETGAPVPFEVEEDDTFRVILVGDESFVRGEQTYVISYTLRDVILPTADRDEFYWDVAPIERQQPIAEFSGRFEFAPALAESLTGASVCFYGPAYSETRCDITRTAPDEPGAAGAQADAAVFSIAPFSLPAGSGVTVGVALHTDSVTQPPVRLPNPLLDMGPIVLAGLAIAAGLTAAVMVWIERRRRRQHRGVVVAQYEVSEHLPPLLAAPVAGTTKSAVAAQLVHLAVRGALRIEDGQEPTGLFKTGKPQPVLRLLDRDRAGDGLDRRTLTDLFGGADPGTAFTLPKKDEKFGQRMQQLAKEGVTQSTKRGYFEQIRNRTAAALGLGAVILGGASVFLAFVGIGRENGLTLGLSIPFGVIAIILGVVGIAKHRVHTPRGAEAWEHLEGVREFIRVAEADRLRVLQGYSGAQRRADGSVDVVELYEKLLPYAMLFGLEKEWGRVLEVVYRDSGVTSPLWYPALGVHGLASLDRTISSFSDSFTSSVSYTSSSSGGTSGGGFSGGGGGGGFSGGR